jgi:hypothetical protein
LSQGSRAPSGEATWRERALNAEDALKVRGPQVEWTEEAIQRITTETTPSDSASAGPPPTTLENA